MFFVLETLEDHFGGLAGVFQVSGVGIDVAGRVGLVLEPLSVVVGSAGRLRVVAAAGARLARVAFLLALAGIVLRLLALRAGFLIARPGVAAVAGRFAALARFASRLLLLAGLAAGFAAACFIGLA